MINNEYHIPVLLHAAVNGLVQDPKGNYVDTTFGGGGHSREILAYLNDGNLIAFDQDKDVQDNLIDDPRFCFIDQNFRYLKNNLRLRGFIPVDGVIADLGVSSYQFDTPDRGFSYRFDGRLDMRMNKAIQLDAVQVLSDYDESELIRVFRSYGELKGSRKIAKEIIAYREKEHITTIQQFIELIQVLTPKNKSKQFLSRIFQAIRIEVNKEMEVLKEMLTQTVEVIKPGGRLVVITYHSLEDRMVKNFIKAGNIEGVLEKDFYGNVIRPFKEVNRKPIIPSSEEVLNNKRARSAKLRIAERIIKTE